MGWGPRVLFFSSGITWDWGGLEYAAHYTDEEAFVHVIIPRAIRELHMRFALTVIVIFRI